MRGNTDERHATGAFGRILQYWELLTTDDNISIADKVHSRFSFCLSNLWIVPPPTALRFRPSDLPGVAPTTPKKSNPKHVLHEYQVHAQPGTAVYTWYTIYIYKYI